LLASGQPIPKKSEDMYVIESVTLKYLLHLDHLRIYRPPIYKSLCPVSWLRPRVSRLFSCLLQREIRVFTYHACRSAVNPGWARWAPAHYKNTKKGHSWPGGPPSCAVKGKEETSTEEHPSLPTCCACLAAGRHWIPRRYGTAPDRRVQFQAQSHRLIDIVAGRPAP
jgi:hypothetical protein